MRVVVNQWLAVGDKTGVGGYADQLFRALQESDDSECFLAYPPRWLQRSRALLQRLRGAASVGPSAGCNPSHTRVRGALRHCGHRLLARHFRAWSARQRPDLYHEPNYIPFASDLPTVTTIHDLSVLLHPEWHPADRVAFLERHLPEALRQCRHFLTGSEFSRQELMRHLDIPSSRVTRVHYGIRSDLRAMPRVQVTATLKKLHLPSQYLLHVGTIEPRKNLLMLLRVYCGLPDRVRRAWPLLLVGRWGWNVEPLRAYFHSQARHRGVLHLGYIADEHLPALYCGARGLLFPSLYEGFGLPPIEMMACGGAVLASTAAAVREAVGPHAHLLAPDDQDGWHNALLRLVSDDDWQRALRQGVTRWAGQYSWARCAAQTLAVYRRVAGNLEDQPMTHSVAA